MGTSKVAKKRILPVWMMEKIAVPARKLAEGRTKRRKKVWTRTETVYCMNEAELVDAALCILAEKCKDREVESASSEDEAQDPLQVVADPLRNSVSRCDSTGSRSPATSPKAPDKREASACSEKTKSEDDDALKYVREIFFS
ncbi:cell cycle regulator of non-homologous end joining [Eublepharis macularius]|uniref:Cell cycle regulator of non-homologous end joining n=1 Tax=Eublepharis macularius TaxID=481883 RepID=A0AA97JVA6_EUBMA|nr:cell cycle regulator of non-homologous end joining [Eublepharis macularius]